MGSSVPAAWKMVAPLNQGHMIRYTKSAIETVVMKRRATY